MADYFVHRRSDPDYRPENPAAFRHVDELLKMMAALTQDHRFEEALEGKGGKPKDMCGLLDRVEERGIEKGAQKKEAELREEFATNMLRDNYPLSAIEKLSKLSEDTIRQIAKRIGVTVV